MSGLKAGTIFFAVVFGVIWLTSPKNVEELMEREKVKCERRGGLFYAKDLGNGVQQWCHGLDR